MSLSRYERGAVVAELSDTTADVARRMRDFHIGAVVVVREGRVIGIVTDRDLVLRVIAEGLDPATTRVETVVTYDPTTVARDESIETALRLMRDRCVRRLPIVDGGGKVTGIVTADDLLSLLTQELADLGVGIRDNVDATESR
ncbi:CBS domain-containing protein [Chondromyces apiculatus]|uniref:Cyclic nucleotide-binding, nucleotidyltransferase putative n=1 Tax=Chondromyces apiculatus DSM 436 TaxID=1192034 RepID=A0A017SUU2_9BACT|nr:CBS domain-containing protein [Chondromyces apiculatus]EYF00744.1 Cyclic nucleotide-binding, nucleotidyltransferase putative [Chondromyces apiculatus DSM 436]